VSDPLRGHSGTVRVVKFLKSSHGNDPGELVIIIIMMMMVVVVVVMMIVMIVVMMITNDDNVIGDDYYSSDDDCDGDDDNDVFKDYDYYFIFNAVVDNYADQLHRSIYLSSLSSLSSSSIYISIIIISSSCFCGSRRLYASTVGCPFRWL
jgi:flagellar basal body-associated protein FliL